jgi:hypothetical protein
VDVGSTVVDVVGSVVEVVEVVDVGSTVVEVVGTEVDDEGSMTVEVVGRVVVVGRRVVVVRSPVVGVRSRRPGDASSGEAGERCHQGRGGAAGDRRSRPSAAALPRAVLVGLSPPRVLDGPVVADRFDTCSLPSPRVASMEPPCMSGGDDGPGRAPELLYQARPTAAAITQAQTSEPRSTGRRPRRRRRSGRGVFCAVWGGMVPILRPIRGAAL